MDDYPSSHYNTINARHLSTIALKDSLINEGVTEKLPNFKTLSELLCLILAFIRSYCQEREEDNTARTEMKQPHHKNTYGLAGLRPPAADSLFYCTVVESRFAFCSNQLNRGG